MGAENGGMIVDISEDGLGFQAVSRVEKGAEIAVSFLLGAGYRISARARIAWVGANGNSGGTTFTRLPADSRSIIREWVTKTAEAEATREAAAAVQAEITAPESEPEEPPPIIERIENSRAPLPVPTTPIEVAPEMPVAAEPLIESVKTPAQNAIQREIPAVEPLATQLDVSSAIPQTAIPQDLQQDVQPDVAAAAELVGLPIAPPAAEPVIQETNQQNLEPLVSQDVQHDLPPTAQDDGQRGAQTSVESVSHSDNQQNRHAGQDTPLAMQPEAHEESTASPADTSRADISAGDASSADRLPPAIPLSLGMPAEVPAANAPKLSTQAPENKPRAPHTPAAHSLAEPPRPLFPPRDTRELFSRSPWISGQSLPEEERSRKGLIVVITICLVIAASAMSVPYIRSHRQGIGARIESMGRRVEGVPLNNASAAPPSSTPSSSGGAISANPSSPATKPPRVPAPSASTPAPAPQLHPSTPRANAGAGAAPQNRPVAPPLSAIAPAAGSTGLLAAPDQTEFQRAQKYLNGTGGVTADPTEAAELFWRSLEKGNTAAAIPLADLYLQGKGVSRSCLQARILLTAASNKGNAEAIQKLRGLPESCE